MKKNRIIKLNKTEVELSNGEKFTIVHNFDKLTGNHNSFDAAFQSWLARTDTYTAEDFVLYVKSKNEPDRIFLTLEDYDYYTDGEAIPATKEDYEAENN